jgi:ketosteroid isomerase-like protein
MRIRARGRSSGAVVERREWHVWTLRDGKLWRLRIYVTEAEALEAVGLSE